MAFLDKILGKKKKNTLKAKCPITKEPIDEGFGFMLTTSQVIASKDYWDMVMTEPETMSYTVMHFRNDSSGTQMRSMIFDKYSSVDKPWMISDSCISLFAHIDRGSARENAKKWWATEGTFDPENSGPAAEALDPQTYKTWKDYAVLEAGRARIELQ
jgi:hypothetical protein